MRNLAGAAVAVASLVLGAEPCGAEFLSGGRLAVFDSGVNAHRLFAIGSTGRLYRKDTDGTWVDLGPPPGTTALTSYGLAQAAYTTAAPHQAVYVVGATGYPFENLDGTWVPIGIRCGAFACSGPVEAVVQALGATTYVRLFATGSDGDLYELRRNTAGGGFTGPFNHGHPVSVPSPVTVTTTSPIGAVQVGGALVLFVRGSGSPDGHLYQNTFSGLAPGAWIDRLTPGPGAISSSNLRARPFAGAAAAYVRAGGGDVHRWTSAGWTSLGSPPLVGVALTTNSFDVVGTRVVAAAGSRLFLRTDAGWQPSLGKPADTLNGIVSTAVTALDDPDAPGLVAFTTALMSGSIRYLYEWRHNAAVWLNHATYWPASRYETTAIGLGGFPVTEPDVDEWYGHLIAVARRINPSGTPPGCCPRKEIVTAYSADDGVTWTGGPTLPIDHPFTDDWWNCSWAAFRDGAVAFGPNSTAYVILQTNTNPSGSCPCTACAGTCDPTTRVIMFKSTDYGASYTECQPFPTALFTGGDKTNVAVDWDPAFGPAGRVYASVSGGTTGPVWLRYSDDGCATWSTASAVPGSGWPSGLQVGSGLVVADSGVGGDVQVAASTDGAISFSTPLPSGPGAMPADSLNLICTGCTEPAEWCGAGTAESGMVPVLYGSSWPGVAVSRSPIPSAGGVRSALVSSMARDTFFLGFTYATRLCTGTPPFTSCSWSGWAPEAIKLPVAGDQFVSPAVDVLVNDVGGVATFQTFATWYRRVSGSDQYRLTIDRGTLAADAASPIAWSGQKNLTTVPSFLYNLQREGSSRHIGHHRFSRGGRGLHSHPTWIDTRASATGNLPMTYTGFVTPVLW